MIPLFTLFATSSTYYDVRGFLLKREAAGLFLYVLGCELLKHILLWHLSGSQLLKLWWVTSAGDKEKKLGESFQQKYTQFVIFFSFWKAIWICISWWRYHFFFIWPHLLGGLWTLPRKLIWPLFFRFSISHFFIWPHLSRPLNLSLTTCLTAL